VPSQTVPPTNTIEKQTISHPSYYARKSTRWNYALICRFLYLSLFTCLCSLQTNPSGMVAQAQPLIGAEEWAARQRRADMSVVRRTSVWRSDPLARRVRATYDRVCTPDPSSGALATLRVGPRLPSGPRPLPTTSVDD